MSPTTLVLYASGSALIVDFEEVCLRNDVAIISIVKNMEDQISYTSLSQKEVDLSQINELKEAYFLCPLFTPGNRFKAVEEAKSFGLKPYPILSDKNNYLPLNFKHGVGCFINKRVVIGASSSIGDFVIINRGACLGHHLELEDFVSIGPGVVTGGNVTIKRGALVGTGAVILPQKTIGQHAIVGAGAVVTKDVKDYEVVVGNPAKVVKQNKNIF